MTPKIFKLQDYVFTLVVQAETFEKIFRAYLSDETMEDWKTYQQSLDLLQRSVNLIPKEKYASLEAKASVEKYEYNDEFVGPDSTIMSSVRAFLDRSKTCIIFMATF